MCEGYQRALFPLMQETSSMSETWGLAHMLLKALTTQSQHRTEMGETTRMVDHPSRSLTEPAQPSV